MKRKLLTLGIILTTGLLSFAQQGDGGKPYSSKFNFDSKTIDSKTFSEPDIQALRDEDAIVDAEKSGPWRFGFNNETDINFENSGTWLTLPNGDQIWRVELECINALTVNLTFEDLIIPEGNEMFVFNPDKSFILGKFTSTHLYEGQLGTELVPGNKAIVEYYVPSENKSLERDLTIAKVTHGYRTAAEYQNKAFGSSGNCNMNAVCTDGIPWEDQIRAALMLVSGGNGFCSGSMINNTADDGTPYVLTANHCYSNPASWVFRFNWQSETCANPGSSPSFMSMSGAVLRARRTPSDFCLVEITGDLEGGTVPSTINTYFPGWDNSGTNPTTTMCVHHPAGDIKKISFDDDPASPVQAMGSSEPNSSWQVSWDRNTTTEGGSSGSPLFDQNGRIIGQLWGGGASCSNLSAPDYYGRVSNSWEPAGSNSTNQLKFWLDPSDSGVSTISGYDPAGPGLPDDAGIMNVVSPSGVYCAGSFTPEVTLRNYGSNDITSVDIIYDVDGGGSTTYNWTGTLAPGNIETVTLPTMSAADGAHTFNAATANPNSTTDSNTGNDGALSNFTTVIDGQPMELTLITDCWGSEVSWEVQDASNNVMASGSGYSDVTGGETITEEFCLAADQCFDFIISDSYGDGMFGSQWSPSCEVNGDYYITQLNTSTVVATMVAVDADYGDNETVNFCTVLSLDEKDQNNFVVYPNPSTGLINIQFNDVLNASVVVTDLTGRTVYSGKSQSDSHNMNLNTVSNGTYLVTVESNGVRSTQSIVIQK